MGEFKTNCQKNYWELKKHNIDSQKLFGIQMDVTLGGVAEIL